MYSFDDLVDIGGSILENVTDAIERKDFSGLSDEIRRKVGSFNYTYSGRRYQQSFSGRKKTQGIDITPLQKPNLTPFQQNRPMGAKPILKMVFGLIGLIAFVPASIPLIVASAFFPSVASVSTAIITGLLAAGSGALFGSGVQNKRLQDKFNKYAKIIGPEEYYPVNQLSAQMLETSDETLKSLDRMIKAKFLPQARFDAKRTTLMLTPWVYEQYQLAENTRLDKEAKAAARDNANVPPEAKALLAEGEAFIEKIRVANVKIIDDEMSDKLDNMEIIVDRIFRQVEKDPTSYQNLRKFMNYYLPTTEKLINAYIYLDEQPQIGENIKSTKREIAEAMDTINNAFVKLFDSLYEDIAWDVASDISVMQTMMAQDGLTDDRTKKGKTVHNRRNK